MSQSFKKIEEVQNNIIKNIKNSIINSLLFKSAYAALLVHQTQVQLTHVSDIQIENQIQSNSVCQIQNQKKILQNYFINPAQYIQNLFKKFQQNNVQSIIKYGQNFQYRSQLTSLFDKSQEKNNNKITAFKFINNYTLRIIEIFKTVFQGTQFSSSIIFEFSELIRANPYLRKDFILCLQIYRLQGKFQIHQNNFEPIINLITIFLNICSQQLDTYNSKQFMVLSFTYYFIDQNNKKIDLQYYFKYHKIYSNIKWWQCSLLESIYQEHRFKNKKNQSSPNNTIRLWDIKSGGMKKNDSEEDNSTISNICFNQLAYYVHNMRYFDIKNIQINQFAQKYIKILSLNYKMADDIIAMCKSQTKITE